MNDDDPMAAVRMTGQAIAHIADSLDRILDRLDRIADRLDALDPPPR